MTTREQIEIIQAYERGEEIEYRPPLSEWFTLVSNKEFIKEMGYEYEFNFSDYEYRIKRWRAEKGEPYYFLTSELSVARMMEESIFANDHHYNVGNYFRTKEQAEKARDLLMECLTKFHEENE